MTRAAPPPSKKRRLQPRTLPSNPNGTKSKEKLARPLYFDNLEENAIDNVLRFLSRMPLELKWSLRIDLREITGLYGARGELGSFTRSRFTGIRLRNIHHFVWSTLQCPEIDREEIIECHQESFHCLSVPNGALQSFRLVIVEDSVDIEDIRNWTDLISEHCPHIRSLVLGCDDTMARVCLEKLGPKIESLYCNIISSGTAAHCSRLRNLYLTEMELQASDAKVWETIFGNLETLHVESPVEMYLVDFVKKSCRKIKSLELSGKDDAVMDAISKCIAHYGFQLCHVLLHLMTEDQLLRVKIACPKTQISLSTNRLRLAPALKIAGCELKKASLLLGDGSQEPEHVPADWCACKRIETANFSGTIAPADIRRFVKSPKCHLRYFRVDTACGPKFVKDMVPLIARGTGALEQFCFSCTDPPPGAFKEIVDRNKGLIYVAIHLHTMSKKEVLIDLVETFLKSRGLRGLSVVRLEALRLSTREKIPEIEAIRRDQRFRHLSITVV